MLTDWNPVNAAPPPATATLRVVRVLAEEHIWSAPQWRLQQPFMATLLTSENSSESTCQGELREKLCFGNRIDPESNTGWL
jgi:hypothetical protein